MLNVSHPALNVHRLHRHQHRESRMHRSNPMQELVELTSIQIQASAATTDTAQLRTTSTAITSASLETPNSTRRLNGKNTQSTSRINRTFCLLISRSRNIIANPLPFCSTLDPHGRPKSCLLKATDCISARWLFTQTCQAGRLTCNHCLKIDRQQGRHPNQWRGHVLGRAQTSGLRQDKQDAEIGQNATLGQLPKIAV